jgi:hypothetical protein
VEALLIGVAASFNFLIIFWKVEKHRYMDAGLDAGILIMLNMIFSHSSGGAVIATIASAVASLFLLIKKPTLKIDNTRVKDFMEEFKRRMPQQ